MRTTNIRIIAGYRIVSLDAVFILARVPPIHLQADMRRRVYLRTNDLKSNEQLTVKKIKEIREESLLMVRQWTLYLQRNGASGVRVRDAFLPCLQEWLERGHGSMEFLTQIITGHGCFASYLYRIQKIKTDSCEHCEAGVVDTADHTLQECAAWSREREVLKGSVGNDLLLRKIAQEISENRDSWDAMVNLVRSVMRSKERAEREREKQRLLPDRSSRASDGSDTDVT